MATTHYLKMYKRDVEDRLGISLQPGSGMQVFVKAVVPSGAAEAAGVMLGDEVVTIDGFPVESALDAARKLRDCCGVVEIRVERGAEDVKLNDDSQLDETEDGLSEPSEDDIVGEWEQYLEWMIDRIWCREEELRQCQQDSASALAVSMMSVSEPAPPSEEQMADANIMAEYMEAMAIFAQQQQDRLASLDAEAEENREASSALMLCATRRAELEALLERVQFLNEADADRVEAIWQELSSGGESDGGADDDEGAEATTDEQGMPPLSKALRDLSLNTQPSLERVRPSKSVQRLQRARSCSGGNALSSPARPMLAKRPDFDDEVGCLVHPI